MEDLVNEYFRTIQSILHFENSVDDTIDWLSNPDWDRFNSFALEQESRDNFVDAYEWLRGAADASDITVAELICEYVPDGPPYDAATATGMYDHD